MSTQQDLPENLKDAIRKSKGVQGEIQIEFLQRLSLISQNPDKKQGLIDILCVIAEELREMNN